MGIQESLPDVVEPIIDPGIPVLRAIFDTAELRAYLESVVPPEWRPLQDVKNTGAEAPSWKPVYLFDRAGDSEWTARADREGLCRRSLGYPCGDATHRWSRLRPGGALLHPGACRFGAGVRPPVAREDPGSAGQGGFPDRQRARWRCDGRTLRPVARALPCHTAPSGSCLRSEGA